MRWGKVEFFRDNKDEWRWRVRAANNKIVAESGEGYFRRVDAERGLKVARFFMYFGSKRITKT